MLEVSVLNVNVTEEPVVIEGDDAAVVLQRVSFFVVFFLVIVTACTFVKNLSLHT